LAGDVHCILFDFDGTLTATPGHLVGRQSQKTSELCDRAMMLAPYLKALRDFGILLGIISKSTEATVRNSLQAAGLSDAFLGPILGKAVGLEGKMGFIEDLAASGALGNLGSGDHDECLSRILLVDDDVRELDRARVGGVQTFPAPAEGGLQDEDFLQIFAHINLAIPDMLTARANDP
jgi:phosphoglycolate phosphatase-like HAD superfamily hydrolase